MLGLGLGLGLSTGKPAASGDMSPLPSPVVESSPYPEDAVLIFDFLNNYFFVAGVGEVDIDTVFGSDESFVPSENIDADGLAIPAGIAVPILQNAALAAANVESTVIAQYKIEVTNDFTLWVRGNAAHSVETFVTADQSSSDAEMTVDEYETYRDVNPDFTPHAVNRIAQTSTSDRLSISVNGEAVATDTAGTIAIDPGDIEFFRVGDYNGTTGNDFHLQLLIVCPARPDVDLPALSEVEGTVEGGVAYHADAVRFEAGAYLARGGPLTGVVNSPKGTCFYWYRSGVVLTNVLNSVPSYAFNLYDGNGGTGYNGVFTNLSSTDFASVFYYDAGNTVPDIDDGDWYGIARSWDVTDPDPANWLGVTVVGEAGVAPTSFAPNINSAIGPGFDVAWTEDDPSPDFNIMGDGSTETDYREVAQMWATPGVYMTGPQLIAAFWGADNKPKDLGANGEGPTGTPPAIYCDGTAASFADNKGSGGAFSVVGGALTNASTSPSD